MLAATFIVPAANAAGQLNVAVVDSIRAIQQSEEYKSFMETVREELEPEQKAVQALQQEIVALRQQVRDEGEVMAETERRGVLTDIENKEIDWDFRFKKLQKQVQDRQAELGEQMGPKVNAIVQDMVELERYDLVFERRNVGYVNPRHDITAKVTEKLNERYAEGDGESE